MGSTVHVIEPLEGVGHGGRHAVYRAEHLIQKLVTCGVSNATLEEDLEPKMAAAQKPWNWVRPWVWLPGSGHDY